ncbi:MAG: hypothetical protein ACYSWP_24910, partial [Planctomycetota bacterium]
MAARRDLLCVLAVLCVFSSMAMAGEILDPNMLVWYMLDGSGANTVAIDSSGYDHHGYINVSGGDPNWEPNDGRYSGSLLFDNDTAIEVPVDATGSIDTGITISCWLRGMDNPGEDNWVFSIGSGEYQVCAA